MHWQVFFSQRLLCLLLCNVHQIKVSIAWEIYMVTEVKEIVMHPLDGISVSAFHGKFFLVNQTAAIYTSASLSSLVVCI